MLHASPFPQLIPEERDMTFSVYLICRGFHHFKIFLPLLCTRFGAGFFFFRFFFTFPLLFLILGGGPCGIGMRGPPRSAGTARVAILTDCEGENEREKSKSGFLLGIATISLLFSLWALVYCILLFLFFFCFYFLSILPCLIVPWNILALSVTTRDTYIITCIPLAGQFFDILGTMYTSRE
jgi:hypothetical protein